MVNSRNKGKTGERQWRDVLRGAGFKARRGQQYSGGGDSPDVICEELNDVMHFEVKWVNKLNVSNAIKQAKDDCPVGKWRVVAHKKDREGWLVTMPAEDWIDLVKEWKERSD